MENSLKFNGFDAGQTLRMARFMNFDSSEKRMR